MKQRTFFGRYAIPILILVGGLAPFIVYSAGRTVRSNSNRVQDWLPKSFVETGDLAYFRQHFLGDQFVSDQLGRLQAGRRSGRSELGTGRSADREAGPGVWYPIATATGAAAARQQGALSSRP